MPDAPTGLTATEVSGTQIDLAWQPPTDDGGTPITGYQVQVSEDGSTFTDLSSTDENTLTYEQMGLDRGATYHYRVATINSVGTGDYASTSATTYDLPSVPIGLTATPVSATQIDLVWKPPTNNGGTPITGYQVQVSEDGSTFTDLSSTDENTLIYEQMGLDRGDHVSLPSSYYQQRRYRRLCHFRVCHYVLLAVPMQFDRL